MTLAGVLVVALALAPAQARAQNCHVIVTVGGDDDDVVVGALVTIRNERREVIASGTTDGTGTRTLDVAPGRYVVYATASGLIANQSSMRELEAIDGDVAIGLRLWPAIVPDQSTEGIQAPVPMAPGEIRGRVRTSDGLPVGAAEIEATGFGTGILKTVTAADGSYRLRVPPDTYNVVARKGAAVPPYTGRGVPATWDYYPMNFLKTPVTVASGAALRVPDLVLAHARAARVTVTVRDEAGRVPPSIMVYFFSTARPLGAVSEFSGQFAVDADGRVDIGPFLPGVVAIHARTSDASGASPALAASTRIVIDGEPLDDVSLVVAPAASVSGRVEFEGRDRPLHNPGGLRVVDGVGGHVFGVETPSPRGVVHADGTFMVEGLLGGACLTLWGISDGWRLASIDLLGDDYVNRPIPLAPGQVVTGVLMHVVPDLTGSADRGGRCAAPPSGAP